MTQDNRVSGRSRWLRVALAAALLVILAVGVYQVWPTRSGNKLTAYFTNAVGLYQGDEVRVVGVPVGTIDSIEPRPTDVKITMTIDRDVKLPADAKAIIISPNLVAARFIQLTPAYTKGDVMADGASIGLDRTGVPVEWDEVKEQLTQLSTQLGPREGSMQGPLAQIVNQAAATFDGNGDSFRNALRELSQTAGRLGDSRTDLFGTIKNLQILVDALSNSNEQIVQFTNHVASVSQVLAQSSSGLDETLATLNQALGDVRGLLHDSNDALIEQVGKLADFTQILTDHSDDIEQVLHDIATRASRILGFMPKVSTDGLVAGLPPDLVAQVASVIQEALSNVARHARASHVTVSLIGGERDLTVQVSDDGVGLPDPLPRSSGISNLMNRARNLGGTATWTGNEPSGTVMTWRVQVIDWHALQDSGVWKQGWVA